MRMRKSFLGGVVFAALLGLSCDSTVGLDPSQTSFTNLVVPGACKASDNLSRVEFSVMLLGGTEALLPDSDIAREPVTDLLDLNGFQFRLTQDDRGTIEQTSVVVDCDLCGPSSLGTMTKQGVGLRVTDFNFHYSGGEDRRGKRKLIILMLDHSGSLVGVNPTDDTDVKPGRGSDRDDQRISFFLQLVGNLPADHYMSLVSFNGDFANISDQYSTPTVNRDVIREGLEKLNFNEAGKTPLARALDDVYERIIVPNYEDLNPVVVLFTDGAEARDDPARRRRPTVSLRRRPVSRSPSWSCTSSRRGPPSKTSAIPGVGASSIRNWPVSRAVNISSWSVPRSSPRALRSSLSCGIGWPVFGV